MLKIVIRQLDNIFEQYILKNILNICFVACKLIYIFFHGQVHHQFIN